MVLALTQRFHQAVDTRHVGQVGRQRNAFTTEGVGQALGGFVAHIGFARRDVHLGSIGQEPAGDHFADTTRPSGHQDDLALNREQIGDLHVFLRWSLSVVE